VQELPSTIPSSAPSATADPAASVEQLEPRERVFTVRALILGLVAGTFVSGIAYYNDYGVRQNLFVGNHLPLTIYSAFFAFLLIVNPLLRRFGSSPAFAGIVIAGVIAFSALAAYLIQTSAPLILGIAAVAIVAVYSKLFRSRPLHPFSNGELVVTLSMTLAACALPTSGLYRNLPQMLVMPQHYGKAIPDWEKAEPDRYVIEVNPHVFPVRDEAGKVYDGYVQGLPKGKDLPPLRDTPVRQWLSDGVHGIWGHLQQVPLWAWSGPAKVWFPLLIVMFVFVLAMCRIVHRQWSENEQLSYPIAEFAHTLLKRDLGKAFSDIFYNRLFWIAFSAVLVLHVINGWHVYDPRMIKVPTGWSIWGIWGNNFSYFNNAGGFQWYLLPQGTLYLTVIAFAYFLPEEISFSLGISLPLGVAIAATSYQLGHPTTGQEVSFMCFGSYVAMAAVICYTGRYYYAQVFKRAITFQPASTEIDASAIAACRWFLLATVGFIAFLMNLGLDWLLSIMVVFIFGSMFLVLARAAAETGVPFIGTPYFTHDIIGALLGPAAIGPASLYLLRLVSVATMQDNRECLAPYVINNYRLGSRNNASAPGLSRAMLVMLVIGLFVAGVAMLWVIYGRGAVNDAHMGRNVPNAFAAEISREIQKLKRSGDLESSKSVSGLERLSSEHRDTHPALFTFFAIGIGLVAVNAMLRLRYVWWPLHPVAFLFWSVWATSNFVYSFLLGWLIKTLVVKIGGGRVYQNLKPLFIGIIIGDLCGGAFWILYGPARYFWTGEAPKYYGIFPF